MRSSASNACHFDSPCLLFTAKLKNAIPEGYQKSRKNIENKENQQDLKPFLPANPADFSYFSFFSVWIPHEFHMNYIDSSYKH